jgi:hypothetical protein
MLLRGDLTPGSTVRVSAPDASATPFEVTTPVG